MLVTAVQVEWWCRLKRTLKFYLISQTLHHHHVGNAYRRTFENANVSCLGAPHTDFHGYLYRLSYQMYLLVIIVEDN